MATTNEFQVKPDYYGTKEECVSSIKQKANTNPRYKNFNQTHFTAGDVEQFETYRDPTNGQVCIPDIPLNDNRFRDRDFHEVIDWEKYRNLNAMAVMNTFYYIFEKFKKGVFIKIKNNKLAVFLPFSKRNFSNEWSRNVRVDPKYGDMVGFVRYIYELEGRRFFPKAVNKFTDSWYANNCLVRYEFPISEGDTNHPNMSDMFKTLCSERKLPDIEFFINRRDFPIIKRDETEAYEDMFGKNQPLLSQNYSKYAPILSMVTRRDYADIPMPTGEDWARIGSKEGKYFPKACREYLEDFEPIPWNDKKSTAVFRGGSTGCGVTIDTNMRLKLAYISHITPPGEGVPLLDAGITNWNLRPRKLRKERFLQTIDIKKLPFGLVNRLTPQEQTGYKYIVHVDGHVSAFRLSLELGMGSCILLVNSKYQLWFRSMLKPYVHYVPVKKDLSDLISQIEWCRNNNKKCEEIAKNAKIFHDKYLMKDGVLDYLQKLLYDLKKENGVYFYNEKSPFDLQVEEEEKQLSYEFPDIGSVTDISTIPGQPRSYGMLKGMHWVLNMTNTNSKFFELAQPHRNVFKSRLTTVDDYTFAGFSLIAKTALSKDKEKESIHEAFVATKCTNELIKYVPNFAYNFGLCRDSEDRAVILTEYVVGQTLSDYIRSSDFSIRDYIFVVLQISLAIHVAQQQCALVHNDLTSWNIVVQKLPEPVSFDYIIDSETVYQVTTQIVPVIIDFGRSHVVYNDTHYGDVNMYTTSTIQDMLTLLVTSIYEITEKQLSRPEVSDLITLANFISGTKYRPRKFFASGRGGTGELRYFLHSVKKYTRLISDPKYELEEKTPIDLVKYIQRSFHGFPIKIIHTATLSLDRGNARQVFEYTLSDSQEDKIKSFTRVFSRVMKCELPETDNILLVYYILQSLRTNLESVYGSMIKWMENEDIDTTPYTKKYTKTIKHITNMYNRILDSGEKKEFKYKVGDFRELVPAPYTAKTFLLPKEILRLLRDNQELSDLSSYKDIIEITLLHSGKFSLPNNVREYYSENCAKLLKTNSLFMKNNTANYNTLRLTSHLVYSADQKVLREKINDEGGNCTTAEEYAKIYEEILS